MIRKSTRNQSLSWRQPWRLNVHVCLLPSAVLFNYIVKVNPHFSVLSSVFFLLLCRLLLICHFPSTFFLCTFIIVFQHLWTRRVRYPEGSFLFDAAGFSYLFERSDLWVGRHFYLKKKRERKRKKMNASAYMCVCVKDKVKRVWLTFTQSTPGANQCRGWAEPGTNCACLSVRVCLP